MGIETLLNIKYPVIQGAMARISEAELASSVSNAGGLGIIASGGLTKDELRIQIKKCKSLTSKPFGVNIMLKNSNKDELAQLLIEEHVEVVTTGAGSPEPYIQMWKAAGIKVLPVVASVKHAKKMEVLGVDGIIAEGSEAGGHIGTTTTMCLIPQIVDAVSIPVIAAGGIADGRGMMAAEILGASGVQIGTRFLATKECQIAQSYKEAIVQAIDTDTVVTGSLIGSPVRTLKNKMTEEYGKMEQQCASKEKLEALTVGSLKKAVDGNVEFGSLMSGQIAGMIHEVKSVNDVIDDLIYDYQKIRNKFREKK